MRFAVVGNTLVDSMTLDCRRMAADFARLRRSMEKLRTQLERERKPTRITVSRR